MSLRQRLCPLCVCVQDSSSLLRDKFPTLAAEHVVELDSYLQDAFGNATRIDYGTGHETNFAIFLCS